MADLNPDQVAAATAMVNTAGAANVPQFTYIASNSNNFGAKYALSVNVTPTDAWNHVSVPVKGNKDWLSNAQQFKEVVQDAISAVIKQIG
jgi:hypothetical protein